ncbi:fasciclin domain-containing protein [Pontibacter oryzae]|uniref:Fasciclin domain-containing protein n=1 Tax=Pontibacter oryzae TaxID=2304593 RepID=A0A399SL18_9BACT|nr:fasciclin domain-containing protein [Pontibacter oryzae]RIJ42922.1 fasciclin domain-containing protein [Pontibacter oryzae]
MKKRTIFPVALAAAMLFGCASSNDSMQDTTAMDDDMTMSETQTMAGDTETTYDYDVVADPSDTYKDIFSNTTDTEDYNDMFSTVDDTEQYDALTLARKSPNLSTFVTLIEKAELVDDLERVEKFTLFAPTNAAFAKIPKDKLEMLLMPDNKAKLMQVLQAHVLPTEVSSLQLKNNTRIQMSDDSYIPVESDMNGTNIRIGGAQVVRSNIEASNGMIHVIDSVIMPDDARESNLIGD